MSLNNIYHKEIVKKISANPMAILLNGPSVQSLEEHIFQLENKEILYVSVNNRFAIEKNILSKINRKINIWCILSPDEVDRYWQEIYEFLLDDDSIALITSSIALGRIMHLIYDNPMPNSHKIIIIDDIIHKAYFLHLGVDRPIYAQGGTLNSISLLLFYLCRIREQPIYLFGCDGILTPDRECHNIYYQQDVFSVERIKMSNIYNDMLVFDQKWPVIVQELKTHKIGVPEILNVNLESSYKSFPKIEIKVALEKLQDMELSKLSNMDNPDIEDNIVMYNNLISYIQNHNIHKTCSEIETRLNEQFDIIEKKISYILEPQEKHSLVEKIKRKIMKVLSN